MAYDDQRVALLHAFHGPQQPGELGEDFDIKATSDVTKENAAERVIMLPRRIRRAMSRQDQDLLANILQSAIADGFVAGVRWARGAGE